jgi:hypothetical protein
LAGTVASHERSIAANDRQLAVILKLTEDNARNWEQLRREWQAYLNTLPKH